MFIKMDEDSIRKYAKLMQELDLTGFELSENGNTVRLERSNFGKEAVLLNSPQIPNAEEIRADAFDICSPMVGVFYSAPAENASPFVKVGDSVKKGDVIGIIEAMKLINEIVAEQSGIVDEILIENNRIVDFGQVLFRLRKEHE